MSPQPSITLESRGGIHGTLRYEVGTEKYAIAYEHTGDHRDGILVFIKDLDSQLICDEPLKRRSQILRDLQAWAKQSGERISW